MLPRGARLGVDLGQSRVGLAASDPDGMLAMPIGTLRRAEQEAAKGIVGAAAERAANVIYVGLPRHLSGAEGPATRDARDFARHLDRLVRRAGLPCQVRLVDERLTTVTAAANLQQAGRRAKQHRSVIDQEAAVIILQSALDLERVVAERAGEAVSEEGQDLASDRPL